MRKDMSRVHGLVMLCVDVMCVKRGEGLRGGFSDNKTVAEKCCQWKLGDLSKGLLPMVVYN